MIISKQWLVYHICPCIQPTSTEVTKNFCKYMNEYVYSPMKAALYTET